MESLEEEEVRTAVKDVRPRAELCIKMDSGHSKIPSKEQLRSKNIKYVWTREPGNVFVMFENFIEVIKVLFSPNQMEHTVVWTFWNPLFL